ncbi:MAG: M6 family metalloprotease domain-containing protein, partial [Clostridium sp.]|nr:M6 family metalloprotease domain-containing protein [Clostridium sp.]
AKEDFNQLLNASGYKGSGCAMDYFNDQFHGTVEFTFDVSDIVTLPGNRESYGGNDEGGDDKDPAKMIYDACRLADSSIDFSRYDDDGDGYVDNVFVFFAGEDEADGADEDCIWSHAWYLTYGGYNLKLDGVTIDRYACTSELARVYTANNSYTTELAGIGTFCHEYSHTLGLPDLYDTDYDENGEAAGLWHWTALMDGGNMNNDGNTPPYYNCIDRELTGISEPETIAPGEYTLEPININGRYLKIPTSNSKEYFLIECRGNDGWDKYIGYSANSGSGLLVYHIDRTNSRIWTSYNSVNANASHQYADLIEADKRPDRIDTMSDFQYKRYTFDVSGIFFPQGSNVLSSATHPSFRTWSGNELQYSLSDITLNGDGSVSFKVNADNDIIPQAQDIVSETFPDAAIIQWESDYGINSTAYVTYSEKNSQERTVVEVAPYSGKSYSLTLEGLKPQTTYSVEICYRSESGKEGKTVTHTFMTQRIPSVSYPYIHIGGTGIYSAGSRIPLRVYNASEAASIGWELDGKTAMPSEDGYFYLEEQGTHSLKATVNYDGGAKDIIIRQITVK